MPGGTNWTEPETLAAFRLYCSTPFGRLHQRNPEIIALADKLGRTPSAVGMKVCNFASLDPAHRAHGVTGLPNRSKVEEAIWERFQADSAAVAIQAEEAWEALGMPPDDDATPDRPATSAPEGPTGTTPPEGPTQSTLPTGPSEATRTRSVRLTQAFFRRTVLSGYGHRCALTGLAHPALLVASHIIPWSADESRRADPRNGLCLNVLAGSFSWGPSTAACSRSTTTWRWWW